MRVTKKHAARLNEILDAAEQFFMKNGYEQTTINDILAKVEISKGAFYHYFKSKEDAMDAVVERIIRQMESDARAIAADPTLTAHQKMQRIISTANISDSSRGEFMEELHRPTNATLHQKSISGTIDMLAPIMADVIAQGAKEGVYHTAHPLETIEFILAGSHLVFDGGFFSRTPEELKSRMNALIRNIELLLGASEGSFAFLMKNFRKETGMNDK
ncbi:MAG: TetR/AcrR family transcriptional regulator [Deltaproteobacteria bacterium]|nr:TetR/AcrR family transcriptional regulator [Deltaproteobacteria bacterium]